MQSQVLSMLPQMVKQAAHNIGFRVLRFGILGFRVLRCRAMPPAKMPPSF